MRARLPYAAMLVAFYLGAGLNHAILWATGSNASLAWAMLQIVIWPVWLYAAKTGNLWLVDWLPDVFWRTGDER